MLHVARGLRALVLAVMTGGACGRASTAPPPSTLLDFSGTTRVVLTAWTTAPAIVVSQPDSVATIVNFGEKQFIVRRAGDRAARPATEAEFNNFLALFGMSREVLP